MTAELILSYYSEDEERDDASPDEVDDDETERLPVRDSVSVDEMVAMIRRPRR